MAKRLGKFVLQIERDIIDEVATEVVTSTPVDTGFARNGWTPGINAPPIGTTSGLDPLAVASPARINAAAQFLRLGDIFFISNNGDYIDLLAAGYSPQAAAGYIPIAVATGVVKGVARSRSLRFL